MLVLSRKLGEQIQIDNDITVTVLSIEGNRIRLGVDAPIQVPILRKELAVHFDRQDCRAVACGSADPSH